MGPYIETADSGAWLVWTTLEGSDRTVHSGDVHAAGHDCLRCAGTHLRMRFFAARGDDLWLPGTIERLLAGTDLQTCSRCGARCVCLAFH